MSKPDATWGRKRAKLYGLKCDEARARVPDDCISDYIEVTFRTLTKLDYASRTGRYSIEPSTFCTNPMRPFYQKKFLDPKNWFQTYKKR